MLANLTYPTLAGVIEQAHREIERVRRPRILATRSCVAVGCRSAELGRRLAARNPTCRSAAVLQQ